MEGVEGVWGGIFEVFRWLGGSSLWKGCIGCEGGVELIFSTQRNKWPSGHQMDLAEEWNLW